MTDALLTKSAPVVRTHSLYIHGLESRKLTIEVLKSRGLAQLNLTGLPDSWLRDSRDKVKSLVARLGRWGPMDRLLVHMLPVDEPKSGAHLELPIALAAVASLCQDQLSEASMSFLDSHTFVGALSLDGQILPTEMETLCRVTEVPSVVGADDFSSLSALWDFIVSGPSQVPTPKRPTKNKAISEALPIYLPPETKVLGREWEKFWIFIAAVLEMPVLLMGAPGLGKSLLARWAHALTITGEPKSLSESVHIWQIAGLSRKSVVPLVEPHSRSPLSEFIGVQRKGRVNPGFFSLSHGGLLVLDEFAELNRDCREILRNVLDQKVITRNLRGGLATWPARFWMIATTNPCPCGYSQGQDYSKCQCLASARQSYRARLSGPLYERLAMRLFVKDVKSQNCFSSNPAFILAKNFITDNKEVSELAEQMQLAREQMHSHLPRAQEILDQNSKFDKVSLREKNSKKRVMACLLVFFNRTDAETLIEELTAAEKRDFTLKETFECL